MTLPEYVQKCVRALESAGYAAWLVGGCVRDDLLGIPPHDFDICTDALPEQTQAVFREYPITLDGVQHGTVKVDVDGQRMEITTFRRDGDYRDSRHPDSVTFVREVEADLERRDFTVNAIAWSPTRGYADPFGGRRDLESGILRTVGEPAVRFQEDALRILRGIRFAARFRLEPEPDTLAAMTALAPLTEKLARERVFAELSGFLLAARAEDLTRFAPVVTQVIPELSSAVGFDQHSPHHAYDVYTHITLVTQAVPSTLTLRWAALLHDIGKVPCFTQDENGRGHFKGHAPAGAALADSVLQRLRAPKELRERVVWLIAQHMARQLPDRKLLRRSLSRFGAEALEQLLLLQEADMVSKGTQEDRDTDRFPRMRAALADLMATEGRITVQSLAVNGADLMGIGLSGREIGSCLEALLEQVLDETLPNEKQALLSACRK